jgi:hypothetical protein
MTARIDTILRFLASEVREKSCPPLPYLEQNMSHPEFSLTGRFGMLVLLECGMDFVEIRLASQKI